MICKVQTNDCIYVILFETETNRITKVCKIIYCCRNICEENVLCSTFSRHILEGQNLLWQITLHSLLVYYNINHTQSPFFSLSFKICQLGEGLSLANQLKSSTKFQLFLFTSKPAVLKWSSIFSYFQL